jgi:hypothetical protein
MFRTVFPFIIRSLRLYIQHHIIQVLWLLASQPDAQYLKFILFWNTLYRFRMVFLSIIRSLRLYIQHQVCHTGSVAAC